MKFTNKFHGHEAKFNWRQETDDPNAYLYPYMFKVSNIGTIVVHAENLPLANGFIRNKYLKENIKYLSNI